MKEQIATRSSAVAVPPARGLAWRLNRSRLRTSAPALVLAAVLFGSGLLCAARFDALPVGTYLDDAYYIVTARALASGAGFALVSYPGNPPEVKYPPGFPVLLAPMTLATGDNLPLLRLPSMLFALAAIPVWFVVLRRWLPFAVASILLAAIATNELVVETSTMVLSENPFMLLTGLLFLVVGSWLDARRELRLPHYVVLAGLLVALYFTRSIGIVFCAALVLSLLLSRRVKDAAILIGLVFPTVVAWGLRNYLVAGGMLSGGYEREIVATVVDGTPQASLLDRISAQAGASASFYATAGVPGALSFFTDGHSRGGGILERLFHADWIYTALAVFVSAVVGVGLLWRGRRLRFAALAVALLLVVLLAWPEKSTRLLHPVVPLLYLFLYAGLGICCGWLPRTGTGTAARMRAHLPSVLIAVLVVWNVFRGVQDTRALVPNRTDFQVGATWLAQNTPAESVVMTEWPVLRYLYAGRKMVDSPAAGATDSVRFEGIQTSNVDYVLLAPPHASLTPELDATAREEQRWLAEHPELFQPVFSDQERNVSVYKVLKRG